MPLPRLVHALALTVALSLAALLAVTVPACSGPPVRIASSRVEIQRPMSYPGPDAATARALEARRVGTAVRAVLDARFYAWASTLPAPAPPATAPADPPAPAPRGTGDASAAIAHWFPDLYDSAYGVAACESTLDPGAVSPGGGNWGLFQINSVHRADFEAVTGRPWSAVLDADTNARYAKHLYDQSGWGPWSCAWAA